MKKNKWARYNNIMVATVMPMYLILSFTEGTFAAWEWQTDCRAAFAIFGVIFAVVGMIAASGFFDIKD